MVTIDPDKHLELGEVDLTENEAESMWAHAHPGYSSETRVDAAESDNFTKDIGGAIGIASEGSPTEEGRVSWVICNVCQAVIMHPNAKFCPSCGADLSSGAKGETLLDLHGQGEKCIVCRAIFREGDIAIRCPHCGRLAHRVHLLERQHVKGFCPACEEKLDEEELKAQLGYAAPMKQESGPKNRGVLK